MARNREITSDGAVVETIDGPAIKEMMAAHTRGERGPVRLLVIPKYAPKGTVGWVYEVSKVNPSTVSLTPLGGGRGLKIDPFTLAEAQPDDIAAFEKLVAAGKTVQVAEAVRTGAVVRVDGDGWKQHPDALWTVVALKGMTEVSIARLGGDDGRMWPKIPASYITAVIAPQALREAMNADPRFRDL